MNRVEKYGIFVGIIVFILALVSPIFAYLRLDVNGDFWFRGVTLFGDIFISSDGPLRIWLYDAPLVTFGNFLFVVFRFGFPVQIVRYYRGRTTGMMTVVTAIIGEVPSILVILGSSPTLYLSQFAGPLPFQIVVALVLIWLRRPPPLTDPWDDDPYAYLDAYPDDNFPQT